MAVLITAWSAMLNRGLDKMPAIEVAITATTKPTCRGRIPGRVQVIGG